MPLSKKILVVDDEQELVGLIQARLEASGYTVFVAYDGQEALEKARDEKPDLILLDVMMPKMDGYQVCRFLKFDENYQHIPVILLTARGQERDKVVGKEVGADDYITKPFDNQLLLNKIQKFIGD